MAAKELRQTVKARFFPYAEARGFIRAKSTHRDITVFRRLTADTVQVFNVQWDKYGDPCFIVNFGEGPKDGVVLWGKHIPGEALETQDCPESGRLQRKAGASKRSWFQLNKPLFEAMRTMKGRYPAEAVVEQLLVVFPEVEAWWQHRTVGPHLTINPQEMWKLAHAAAAAV